MRGRNFTIACLIFIIVALLYNDYSKNELINKQKDDVKRMWETQELLKNSISNQWRQLVIQDEVINKMINE